MPIFDAPIHTSSQSIDRVLKTGLPVVVIFWRNNCAPCRQLDPTISWLAGDYAGKLLFAKIDADTEPELLKRFDISALPGLVFVKNGQVEAVAAGAIVEAELRRWCDYLVGNSSLRPAIPTGPSIALRPTAPARSTTGSTAAATPNQSVGKPIRITDVNFDSLINGDLPVLVDFWAPWCGPCHQIAPVIEALAKEYAGKLVVGKLNVDENQRTAGRYNVMSIPTIMIFRDGKAVDQVVGALPAHVLRQRVRPHVN